MKNKPVNSKSRKATRYRGVVCLNCDQPLDLSDRYCPYCGQINTTKKLSFKDFFEEFFGSIFSYDSKFRRTISALILHPGKITREYISGKRTMYSNPFRFYFTVSIIFFILWGFTSGVGDIHFSNNRNPFKLNSSLKEVLKNPQRLDSLNKIYGKDDEKLDSVVRAIVTAKRELNVKDESSITENELDTLNFI
ncbi:MAG: DUF3667 domain-containing protein, partial [Leeuwenhoekiella sp.]